MLARFQSTPPSKLYLDTSQGNLANSCAAEKVVAAGRQAWGLGIAFTAISPFVKIRKKA